MPKQNKLLLYGLTWVAAYFRISSLFQNHYHADEALFSSWARLIAVWRDPLLTNQLVDKPPLLFYMQALFFPLFGPVEWASRLPNLIASLLLVPLIALLSWKIYHLSGTTLLAAFFVALFPMAIQYSATAYTDPFLVTFLVLSLLLVIEKPKPALSGFIFGLAVATKYQAWLFLPLLFGFAWLYRWEWRTWLRWSLGFLPLFLLLVFWEFARSGTLTIWSNQINNFGGLRLINSWEMNPRLLLWFDQWQLLFGSPFLMLVFTISCFLLIGRAIKRPTRTGLADLILILYLIGYAAFHWLLAVPVWDRYLLPILPFVAIILSRSITGSASWISHQLKPIDGRIGTRTWDFFVVLMIVAILLYITIPAAQLASDGKLPTGGRPSSDQGAWQIAELLADEPYGTVLYDHWYSWHWRYHFFDTGVYVSWFPHPTALVEDLNAFGDRDGTRYIVLPNTSAARPIVRAITDAGYQFDEVFRTSARPGMILYRLVHQRESLS